MDHPNSDETLSSHAPSEKKPTMLHLTATGNRSSQKSSRSTFVSDRSASRKKVMIPKSQKLAHFFNNSQQKLKSFSTTSVEYPNAGKKKDDPELQL
jgi:hypothetical protein